MDFFSDYFIINLRFSVSVCTAGSRCDDCMTRVPYATMIATIMCIIGVGVFCGTMYRGSTLTALMLDQVFHIRLNWYALLWNYIWNYYYKAFTLYKDFINTLLLHFLLE